MWSFDFWEIRGEDTNKKEMSGKIEKNKKDMKLKSKRKGNKKKQKKKREVVGGGELVDVSEESEIGIV